jgi:hypothetical protein
MWNFLNRNAGGIQAVATILTTLLALAALVGVKLQIDASDQIQRAQSARDIYREFLAVSISKPEFARPNYCAIAGSAQEAGYESYIDYLLFAADQTIAVDADWKKSFALMFKEHAHYICTLQDLSDEPDTIRALLLDVQSTQCAKVKPCDQ